MRTTPFAASLAVLLLLSSGAPVLAADADANVTLLHLGVTGTVHATPNLLTASLAGTATAVNAASAQRQLDASMRTATVAAGAVKGVDWQVQDYAVDQMQPDGGKGQTLWTAHQTLLLRSTDAEALLGLVGRLQGIGLAVAELQWVLSPAQLADAQQKASMAALSLLRQRAEAAASTLGLKLSGMRSVTLGEPDRAGPLPMMRMMVAAAPQASRSDADISEHAEAVIALVP